MPRIFYSCSPLLSGGITLQSDLQKLLDEFRLPTPTYSKALRSAERTDRSDAGVDESQPADVDPVEDEEDRFIRGEHNSGHRASNKKVRKAPEGAKLSRESRALECAPTIEILREASEIEAKGIKGRAGRYYKDTQTLFVNGLYSAVDRKTAELEVQFPDSGDAEAMRAIVLTAAQRTAAFRVGKAICFAISKRLVEDWSLEDLERATSPESLSLAADDYRQSINAARKWIKTELKALGVESEDLETA